MGQSSVFRFVLHDRAEFLALRPQGNDITRWKDLFLSRTLWYPQVRFLLALRFLK